MNIVDMVFDEVKKEKCKKCNKCCYQIEKLNGNRFNRICNNCKETVYFVCYNGTKTIWYMER